MSAPENPAAFASIREYPMTGGGSYRDDVPGMTLRDWFAGQFVMGFRHSSVTHTREHMAEEAYRMADALLAARGGR
jgi:hypothetical protein